MRIDAVYIFEMEQLSPDLGGFCMLIAMFAGVLALRLGINLRDAQ